jgi:cytochrome c peroxidase
MHDGSVPTLEEAVDFYNEGGRQNPALDGEIRPLNLLESEKVQLVAFLRALSGVVQAGAM